MMTDHRPRWQSEWDVALWQLANGTKAPLHKWAGAGPDLLVSYSEAARRLTKEFAQHGDERLRRVFTKDQVFGRWKLLRRPGRCIGAPPYTRQQITTIATMLAKGRSHQQIADFLGRSRQGIGKAIARHLRGQDDAPRTTRHHDVQPTPSDRTYHDKDSN